MDVSATSNTASARSGEALGAEYSTKVMRKVLDMASVQGAQLAQMVAQASGVGQNVDTSA